MESATPNGSKLVRLIKRCLKWGLLSSTAYVAVLLIGLIPVNNDYRPPAESGVRLYIVSNSVHADIIMPKQSAIVDWTQEFASAEFHGDITSSTHVAIGWGDRGFFLKTETWDDLKLSVAANALLVPSKSCVHVAFTRPEYYDNATCVTISEAQYELLVEFINESLVRSSDGKPCQIRGYAYASNDGFFDAHGHYHLLNTCNSWVGRGLKRAGVRVPWFSPMPKTPTLYIQQGNDPGGAMLSAPQAVRNVDTLSPDRSRM